MDVHRFARDHTNVAVLNESLKAHVVDNGTNVKSKARPAYSRIP